jgi:hypothetical protein
MSVIQPTSSFVAARPAGALVSKIDPIAHADRYLHLIDAVGFEWVSDPDQATPFANMRDASRVAVRLPAKERAFSVPALH